MEKQGIKIVPAEGCWLTQKNMDDERQRIFSDAVFPAPNTESDWIEWTDEQKQAWEQVDWQVEMPLREAKSEQTQRAIAHYDKVGYTCSYGGIPLSVDYDTRSRLRIRLQAEKAAGKETTTLWYSSHRFDLPIAATEQMLSALELYAAQCFDTKNQHLANIAKLESVEDVVGYDYTANYPEQLKF